MTRIIIEWPRPRGGILLPWGRRDAVCARRATDGRWVVVTWSPPLDDDGEHEVTDDDVLAEFDEGWEVRTWRRGSIETDFVGTLGNLCAQAGLRVTFSAFCVSGLAHLLGPSGACECWRCRKQRGLDPDPEMEKSTYERARRAEREQRGW